MLGDKSGFSNSMKKFSENELAISQILLGRLKGEQRTIWS